MKPTEIYALPNDYSENLFYASQEVLQEVFPIDGLRHFDFENEPRHGESELMLHRKLQHTIDQNNWVSLQVLEFNKKPFAIISHLGTDHSGNEYEVFVTDRETYEAAMEWLQSRMRKDFNESLLVSEDEDLRLDFAAAALSTVRGQVRLMDRNHVGLHTGVAIFDEEVVSEGYVSKFRPLGHEVYLDLARVAEDAAQLIADAVISDRKVIVGEFIDQDSWLACLFQADGETYAVTVNGKDIRSKDVHWYNRINVERVGFAPMYDLVESFHETGKIDLDSEAAKGYADAFGLTSKEANMAIGAVAQGAGDFLEAAVVVLSDRKPTPDGFDIDPIWIHARLLAENPKLAKYGLGQMPSLKYASTMWARWQAIQVAKAEAPAPRR